MHILVTLASAQVFPDYSVWGIEAKHIGKIWLPNGYILAFEGKTKKSTGTQTFEYN